MQPSSSRAYISESSPARKDKTQLQREYRSREMDGFSELRDALLLVDPLDAPLGRDATRHQLLITAAKKLRDLAEENEKLVLQLSAMPTAEPHARIPRGITAQKAAATGVAWSTQPYDMEHLTSMTSPSLQNYNTIPGWIESSPPFHGFGHQPYDVALGSPHSIPPMPDMRLFH